MGQLHIRQLPVSEDELEDSTVLFRDLRDGLVSSHNENLYRV